MAQWIVTAVLLGALIAGAWMTVRRIERERALWWEITHPPDRVDEEGETSSTAAAVPLPLKGKARRETGGMSHEK